MLEIRCLSKSPICRPDLQSYISLILMSEFSDFDETDMLLWWGWECGHVQFSLHRGRDSGLGHDTWVGER